LTPPAFCIWTIGAMRDCVLVGQSDAAATALKVASVKSAPLLMSTMSQLVQRSQIFLR
jgi:hypothetical protein